jgi:hypothetical protein
LWFSGETSRHREGEVLAATVMVVSSRILTPMLGL